MDNSYFEYVLRRQGAARNIEKIKERDRKLRRIGTLAQSRKSLLESFRGVEAGIGEMVESGALDRAITLLEGLPGQLSPLERSLAALRAVRAYNAGLEEEKACLINYCGETMPLQAAGTAVSHCIQLLRSIASDNEAYASRCKAELSSSSTLNHFRGVLEELLEIVNGGDPEGALSRARAIYEELDKFEAKIAYLEKEPVWNNALAKKVSAFISSCRNGMKIADLSRNATTCEDLFREIKVSEEAKARTEQSRLDSTPVLEVFKGVKKELKEMIDRRDFLWLDDSLSSALPRLETLKSKMAELKAAPTFSDEQRGRVRVLLTECTDRMTLSGISSMTGKCTILCQTLVRESEAHIADQIRGLSSNTLLTSFRGVYAVLEHAVRTQVAESSPSYVHELEVKLSTLRQRLSSLACPSWVSESLKRRTTAHVSYCNERMTIVGIDEAMRLANQLYAEMMGEEARIRGEHISVINSNPAVGKYRKLKEELLYWAQTRPVEHLRSELERSINLLMQLDSILQPLPSSIPNGSSQTLERLRRDVSTFRTHCMSELSFTDIYAALKSVQDYKSRVLIAQNEDWNKREEQRRRQEEAEEKKRKTIWIAVGESIVLGIAIFVMCKICDSWMCLFWQIVLGTLDVVGALFLGGLVCAEILEQ